MITVHDGPLDFHDESFDDFEIFKRLNIGYAHTCDICGNLHCYQHYRTFSVKLTYIATKARFRHISSFKDLLCMGGFNFGR